MSVYLAFSIGPVQTFIAEARRTQDLRFGSYVLAQMARDAIEAIGVDAIVYPALPDPEVTEKKKRSVAVPNQLLAIFDDQAAAANAAGTARSRAQAEWQRVANEVNTFLRSKAHGLDEKKWSDQINRFPKVYWAIYDDANLATDVRIYQNAALGGGRTDYGAAVALVEQALGARKLLRDFGATQDDGRKCSVCGQRSVIGNDEFWEQLSRRLHESQLKASSGERLCAVCATKRFALAAAYGRAESYPSTSTMAAAPFVRALLAKHPVAPEATTVIEAHQRALRELKVQSGGRFFNLSGTPIPFFDAARAHPAFSLTLWDGDTLFPETFAPTRLKNDYGIPPGTATAAARKAESATRELVAAVITSKRESVPLTPYYALLQMDGDRMGTLLSHAPDRTWHEHFSKVLALYAHTTVRDIVEGQHAGRLVYAGGDDILALAPVDEVLAMARGLRTAFLEAIAPCIEEIEARGGKRPDHPPDMSAGIAIVHHMSPLDAALVAVRATEAAAKNEYDRGALTVRLLKRSGVPVQMGIRWEVSEQEPIELLTAVQATFRSGRLSSRFAHVLFREAPILAGLPTQAQIFEVKRLLERHTESAGNGEKPGLAFDADALFKAMPPAPNQSGPTKEPVAWEANNALERRGAPILELAKWMQLLQFLAGGGQGEDA